MASLQQIHSARSLVAAEAGVAGEGDALLTRQPGLTISIRTADCYPILLADPVAGVVAAIHAGWRGTGAHIVEQVIERLRSEFGTKPEDIVAAIGPGIGGCCYEVGEDVARRFGMDRAGKLDLAAENLHQLVEAGVQRAHVDSIGACTRCDAQRFHSWRRDGEHAGRMISFIGAR